MLTRYDPWTAMRQLNRVVNTAFNQALTGAEDGSNVVTSPWMPAVDIREEPERFVIAADVPGVDPENIEVTMENGVLTIRGEREVERRDEGEEKYRRVERLHGAFYRRFTLPDTADPDQITAKDRHGVLEIEIRKKATVQPKRIQIAA